MNGYQTTEQNGKIMHPIIIFLGYHHHQQHLVIIIIIIIGRLLMFVCWCSFESVSLFDSFVRLGVLFFDCLFFCLTSVFPPSRIWYILHHATCFTYSFERQKEREKPSRREARCGKRKRESDRERERERSRASFRLGRGIKGKSRNIIASNLSPS